MKEMYFTKLINGAEEPLGAELIQSWIIGFNNVEDSFTLSL